MKDFESKNIGDSAEDSEQTVVSKKTTLNNNIESPVHNFHLGILVLALIFGIVGGIYGSLDLARRPFFQKIFGIETNFSNQFNQTISVVEESATTEVVKKAGPAVVSIVISKDISRIPQFSFDPFGLFGSPSNQPNNSQPNIQQVGAGTGFIVSNDGIIITNKHVVADDSASYSVITNAGQSYEAKVLARDTVNDIAIIKIDIKDAPFLTFADSSKLELGQHVIAIGNSLGQYQNTVTSGIISGIGRSVVAGGGGEQEQLEGVIQTDAAINSGNSGGPLLNLSGFVIGVNTAVDRQGQLIGFALPANDIRAALESFRVNGKILRPYLGVRYTMLTKALSTAQNIPSEYGALLVRGNRLTDFAVIPGSPADKAGLLEGDIILEINGTKLTTEQNLSRQLRTYKPGGEIALKVLSKGQEKTVTVIVGEAK